ncbi:MAG: glycosyltransferase [Prevotella sp.]|nr:glycosyltransferase [Prevotella sp.]
MNKTIAILIPCYNEEQTIAKVVEDFHKQLPQADIYVYDNNSSDGTDKVARHSGAIVRYEERQGKGNVIRRMLSDIEADCYILVDGDDTYPAEYASIMSNNILEDGYDMVIGDRLSATYFQENKRPFHDLGNRLVRYAINKIFHSDIKDIMTGYRAISKRMVRTTSLFSEGFEIETEMTINALDNQLKICQIPVEYRNRPDGSISKLNTFSDGIRILLTIFKLFRDYKPLRFFSYISIVLVILSILFLLPIFIDYFNSGLVPRFPTLIVCSFVILFAILLWLCGLILEVLLNRHRQIRFLISNQIK